MRYAQKSLKIKQKIIKNIFFDFLYNF